VRHAVVPDCIRKRFRDVLLSHEILEGLWAPLSGYDLVAHLEVFSRKCSVFSPKQKSTFLSISQPWTNN